MLQISAIQLAELLAGIGRAQAAIIQGMENELAGIRSGRIIPALQNAAHMRDHPEPTLVDLPVRVCLNSMGRIPPDPAVIARDLERLINGTVTTAATKDEAAAASAPGGGDALDFSAPKPG
jgi:hypothetical protein